MKFIPVALAGLAAMIGAAASQENDVNQPQRALTIVTSASAETQFMALVLTGAVMTEGEGATILLCDAAGDLALKDGIAPEMQPIAPPQKTPRQLLKKLKSDGADVQVCAIYLPNRSYREGDLMEGVTVATPAAMGKLMADPSTRASVSDPLVPGALAMRPGAPRHDSKQDQGPDDPSRMDHVMERRVLIDGVAMAGMGEGGA